ncbi:MAG: hypothetical protein ABI574_13245 [Burkholderiales bacterium]
MNRDTDYWSECIAIAAEECDLTLTPEQLAYLASAASSGHEHYGMAFYSPPPSDRLNEIERDGARKLAALQKEFDAYRGNAEIAIKQSLRVDRDALVTIGEYGTLLANGVVVELPAYAGDRIHASSLTEYAGRVEA